MLLLHIADAILRVVAIAQPSLHNTIQFSTLALSEDRRPPQSLLCLFLLQQSVFLLLHL